MLPLSALRAWLAVSEAGRLQNLGVGCKILHESQGLETFVKADARNNQLDTMICRPVIQSKLTRNTSSRQSRRSVALSLLVASSLASPVTMAWRCHGNSNQSLVKALKEGDIIRTRAVEQAMLAVDRGLFLPKGEGRWAYSDAPQPIGCGQTISAPHMHAHCLELLSNHLQPGNRVLDVGSGSGYLAAVMARMVCPPGSEQQGMVVGVEHFPELVQHSIASVRSIDWARQLMDQGKLKLLKGDGRQGYHDGAPYHAIHVGAAAPQVPQALADQLAPGGRMVIPVGDHGYSQDLMVIDKPLDGSHYQMHSAMGVMYVPLTDLPGSRRSMSSR